MDYDTSILNIYCTVRATGSWTLARLAGGPKLIYYNK